MNSNYCDSRTPEERANEPKGVITTSSTPTPPTEKEDTSVVQFPERKCPIEGCMNMRKKKGNRSTGIKLRGHCEMHRKQFLEAALETPNQKDA